jgi:hypothetical protein
MRSTYLIGRMLSMGSDPWPRFQVQRGELCGAFRSIKFSMTRATRMRLPIRIASHSPWIHGDILRSWPVELLIGLQKG